jgi:hypothetical protein
MCPVDDRLPVTALCEQRRGKQLHAEVIDEDRMLFKFDIPTAEVSTRTSCQRCECPAQIIVDFCDALKRITSGYGTFDYEPNGYIRSNLVKMDIKVKGNLVCGTCCAAGALVCTYCRCRRCRAFSIDAWSAHARVTFVADCRRRSAHKCSMLTSRCVARSHTHACTHTGVRGRYARTSCDRRRIQEGFQQEDARQHA